MSNKINPKDELKLIRMNEVEATVAVKWKIHITLQFLT